MSKIITIFSNPGTGSPLASTSSSDKVEDNKTLTSLGHSVDEENFAKPRHVASLFNSIARARSVYTTAHNIGIVSDSHEGVEDSEVESISQALGEMYNLHSSESVLKSIEITDAQMEYLESNPQAMEVFIDNATIQADNLSWDKESVESREEIRDNLNQAADSVESLVEAAYDAEDDDPEDWNDCNEEDDLSLEVEATFYFHDDLDDEEDPFYNETQDVSPSQMTLFDNDEGNGSE